MYFCSAASSSRLVATSPSRFMPTSLPRKFFIVLASPLIRASKRSAVARSPRPSSSIVLICQSFRSATNGIRRFSSYAM